MGTLLFSQVTITLKLFSNQEVTNYNIKQTAAVTEVESHRHGALDGDCVGALVPAPDCLGPIIVRTFFHHRRDLKTPTPHFLQV